MKNDELFFIKENNYNFDFYDNRNNLIYQISKEEINEMLEMNDVKEINVDKGIVDDLHELIYSFISNNYLDEYFKVEEKLKDVVPFTFYYQPLIVNIAKEFIDKSKPVVILNNPILKYFEIIDYSSRIFKEKTISGYGYISLPDIVINFIEHSLGSIKQTKNIDGQILYYFYLFNSTLPIDKRLNNEDFYDFYLDLGKETILNNETLKYVLSNPKVVNYFHDIISFLKR